VLQDAGNLYEAIWAAVRCALCDTRVPRTKEVGEAVKVDGKESTSAFDALKGTKWKHKAQGTRANFELADLGDEGEPLNGGEVWPVGVTLNVVCVFLFIYFLKIIKKRA
jgi:exosome complex component RRP42